MNIITTATATEMQNNFGRYLNLVLSGQEIIDDSIANPLKSSYLSGDFSI